MKKGIGYIFGIICGILLYFIVNAKMSEQRAIAIIGGADGPTSIFVAGKVGGGDILLIVVVGIALVAGVIWLIRKNKKK